MNKLKTSGKLNQNSQKYVLIQNSQKYTIIKSVILLIVTYCKEIFINMKTFNCKNVNHINTEKLEMACILNNKTLVEQIVRCNYILLPIVLMFVTHLCSPEPLG